MFKHTNSEWLFQCRASYCCSHSIVYTSAIRNLIIVPNHSKQTISIFTKLLTRRIQHNKSPDNVQFQWPSRLSISSKVLCEYFFQSTWNNNYSDRWTSTIHICMLTRWLSNTLCLFHGHFRPKIPYILRKIPRVFWMTNWAYT